MPAVGDFFLATTSPLELSFSLGPLKGRKTRMVDGTKNRSAEPWTNADRFFLVDALARGMSIAEVAAFLGRTEEEVREQGKATKYPPRPRVQR